MKMEYQNQKYFWKLFLFYLASEYIKVITFKYKTKKTKELFSPFVLYINEFD
jgi:hypothetical protein